MRTQIRSRQAGECRSMDSTTRSVGKTAFTAGYMHKGETMTINQAMTVSRCLVDTTELPRRKPGAKPGNLNAAKTLEYAHDIEDRVDGRSLLAEGFRSHRGRLLATFNVEQACRISGNQHGGIPRQTGCRPIREALSRVYKSFGVSTRELRSSQRRARR
jgi:hypothetical protein